MRRDESYLLDMLLRSRDALRFAKEAEPLGLGENTMAQFAVLHALQIVGEAAGGVSEEARSASPGIPWVEIVGMRHRIAGRIRGVVNPGTADRQCDAVTLAAVGKWRCGQHTAEAFGKRGQITGANIGQQHGKLVAAHSGQIIGTT